MKFEPVKNVATATHNKNGTSNPFKNKNVS